MIRSSLPKMLILLTLVALFGVVFYGQAILTTVTGTIIGPDGKPVEGAEIKFERTDIKANYSIKTNKDGKFTYATLPMGTFTISVTVAGNVIARMEGAKTNPAKPMPIDIDMRKLAAGQDALAPTAEERAQLRRRRGDLGSPASR